MALDDKVTIDTKSGQIVSVPCTTCLVITKHNVLTSVKVEGYADEYQYWYQNDYQIVQCAGCSQVSVRSAHIDSVDVYADKLPDGNYSEIQIVREEFYPIRIAGRTKLKNAYHIPQPVRSIYNEVHIALGNQLPILASVGIRSLVEAICFDKKALGTNLKERIDSLVSLAVLTTKGAEILHVLRDLGNESVHEFKALDLRVLESCLDVIESVINNIYIIPKLAEGFVKDKK